GSTCLKSARRSKNGRATSRRWSTRPRLHGLSADNAPNEGTPMCALKGAGVLFLPRPHRSPRKVRPVSEAGQLLRKLRRLVTAAVNVPGLKTGSPGGRSCLCHERMCQHRQRRDCATSPRPASAIPHLKIIAQQTNGGSISRKPRTTTADRSAAESSAHLP